MLGIASFGLQLMGDWLNAQSEKENALSKVYALRKERNFNIGLLKTRKKDKFWTDMMSAWASGTSTGIGTSTFGAIQSNQQVLEEEIKFQEAQYKTQIQNMEEFAHSRFFGIF